MSAPKRVLFTFDPGEDLPFEVIAHVDLESQEVVTLDCLTNSGDEPSYALTKRIEERAVEVALREAAEDRHDMAENRRELALERRHDI
jgi:hypothetical protein